MNIFVVSMIVGGAGLLSMAVGGLTHHGADGHGGDGHGHGGHGHGFDGHGGHGHGGHGHDGGHGGHGGGHHSAGGHGATGTVHHGHDGHDAHASSHGAAWLLAAPRLLFSFLLGFGAVGLVLDSVLRDLPLIAVSIAGGAIFVRMIISPIWNFAMRFASKPALTLESALMDEATAVTSFNRDGEGIVSIELDGQVIQVLGQLRREDRAVGAGVRAGQRVRIEEVNSAQNRCTVSVL